MPIKAKKAKSAEKGCVRRQGFGSRQLSYIYNRCIIQKRKRNGNYKYFFDFQKFLRQKY